MMMRRDITKPMVRPYSNGIAFFHANEGWQAIDQKGRPFGKQFQDIRIWDCAAGPMLFYQPEPGGLWGLLGRNLQILAKPRYTDVRPNGCNIAFVAVNGRWGSVSSRNQIVTRPKFDDLRPFSPHGTWAKAMLNGKMGIIDGMKGEEILPPAYDNAAPLYSGYTAAKTDGRWYVHSPHVGLLPEPFDEVREISGVHAMVRRGQKWGFFMFDPYKGNPPLSSFKLDDLRQIGDLHFQVMAKRGNKWGVVRCDIDTTHWRWLAHCRYDSYNVKSERVGMNKNHTLILKRQGKVCREIFFPGK